MADEPQSCAIPRLSYSDRSAIRSIVARDDSGLAFVGQRAVVGGWVQSVRKDGLPPPALLCRELMSQVPALRCIARLLFGPAFKNGDPAGKSGDTIAVLWINDGSCAPSLQAVVESAVCPPEQITAIGASVLLEGVIQAAAAQTQGGVHAVELKVEKILHFGAVDAVKYHLRSNPLLGARTTTGASAARIRSGLIHAMHVFFANNGFFHVNPPVITSAKDATTASAHSKAAAIRAAVEEKTRRLEELKRTNSTKDAIDALQCDLDKTIEMARQLEFLPSQPGLHLEPYACALSSVYAFSPVLREGTRKKQMAEMWVTDVEIAFAELEEAMNLAEECIRSLCRSISDGFADDLKLLGGAGVDSINAVTSRRFERITYAEALSSLAEVSGATFGTSIQEMGGEHQRYLAEEIYKGPIIVYNFPKHGKPFFARVADDGTSVSAFDIVVPKVGILVSGTQKEERLDHFISRIDELGLPRQQLEWYADLRRHGSVKHSGFSMNFESLVFLATGLEDPRDSGVPFPRAKL